MTNAVTEAVLRTHWRWNLACTIVYYLLHKIEESHIMQLCRRLKKVKYHATMHRLLTQCQGLELQGQGLGLLV